MGVVRHEAAKVAAHNAVPRWLILLVELLLDVGSNILLNVKLLHCLKRHLDRVRLHVLGHVGILNRGLVVVVVHDCGGYSKGRCVEPAAALRKEGSDRGCWS
ncbi:dynein light chain, putative [Leishmania tarentolae]|uniref:Dynein light chain, putative n=1 Tax=Leishmania tarentolae TaxID=5689 RepID=A0A640KP23_LEITA|nr:dynein light chain, putative [Leishmania tarentolae]